MVFVAIMLSLVFYPAVSAQTSGPRSGETVTQTQLVVIHPDYNWTAKLNIANGSEYDLLDYNASWAPFFVSNPDLKGILVHSTFLPYLFSLNSTNETISLGSMFRLKPDQLMDGASEIWMRLPLLDLPSNATIRYRVMRVQSPLGFNMSYGFYGIPSFNNSNKPQVVYDWTLDPTASNQTSAGDWSLPNTWIDCRRWQNISLVNGTLKYNWTYVKMDFALFPNEWYLFLLDAYVPYKTNMKVAFSVSDFGSDGKNNTWLWFAGHTYYVQTDLDTAFVATYGMSNGITGIGVSKTHYPGGTSTMCHFNSSIPIGQTVSWTLNFFEVIVPFFQNASRNIWVLKSLTVCFYSSVDDSALVLVRKTSFGGAYDFNSSYTFYEQSWDLISINNTYIDHIRFDFQVPAEIVGTKTNMSEAVKLWGTQRASNLQQRIGWTDIYFNATASPSGQNHTMISKMWFIPVGFFQLSHTYWTIVNGTIVPIPIATPTPSWKIIEAIQAFEAYLVDLTNPKQPWWNWIGDKLGDFIGWIAKQIPLALQSLHDYFFKWNVLEWVVRWCLDIATGKILPFSGVALWFWKLINSLIDMFEWFAYWGVRIIYLFSIAIVYALNVFAVISINSALLAVAKTGNGRDFVRAFKAGWRQVLAIMTLLISLGILAISIVGAVIPI